MCPKPTPMCPRTSEPAAGSYEGSGSKSLARRSLFGRLGIAIALLLLVASSAASTEGQAPQADEAVVQSPSAEVSDHREDSKAHRLLQDIEKGVVLVEPWLQRYGYGAVLVAVGVEGFGIPAPGQTILEAGAVVAAMPNAPLGIGWLLFVTFVAASLGNSLGYAIGRWGGRSLVHRLRVDPRRLEKIEAQFNRYGGWIILFARFLDGPRQLNGIAAGALEMPWVRFTVFNLAGAALWTCFWGLGVYYLDLHLDQIVAFIRHINPWIAAATLAGVGAFGVRVLLRYRERERTGSRAGTPGD